MKTVLLVTSRDSVHANAIIRRVEALGGRAVRLNLGSAATNLSIRLHQGPDAPHQGAISVQDSGRVVSLAEVDSVFYHQAERIAPPPGISAPEAARAALLETETALRSIFMISEATWVNDYHASRRAELKAVQQEAAVAAGLRIPATLITNEPDALLRFTRVHGSIAVKYLERAWFRVEGWPFFHYTTRIGLEEVQTHLDTVRRCPVFVQEYIPKQYEVRATLVGDRIFACRIDSQVEEDGEVDWRKADDEHLPHTPIQLPRDVAEQLIEIHRKLGIFYGAADLIVTPEGEHVFLETNPGGAWLWVEDRTGMPISQALAQALVKPSIVHDFLA